MKNTPDSDWYETTITVSLGDWALHYLDYALAKFANKTYTEKKRAFRRLFLTVSETMPVEDMTAAKALLNAQTQMQSHTGNVANKDRKNLLAAWNWGKRYMTPTLPKENPFDVEKMPEVRSPRYVPPPEDFWKAYGVAEGQDQVMLLACLFLAARRGEIFRLKIDDVDFDNNQIRLWTRKRENGNWESDWLPMVNALKEALQAWIKERGVESEYVFVCVDKTAFTQEFYGKPFTTRQHLLERLCEKANVKKFGFHGIRHLTASQLYKQGCTVAEIQKILRHTSPNTTVRYLKSLGIDNVRNVMDTFQTACQPMLG